MMVFNKKNIQSGNTLPERPWKKFRNKVPTD